MTHLSTWTYVLWIGPIPVQILMLCVIMFRKLQSELPWFSTYMAFDVGRMLVLLGFRHDIGIYIPMYWTGEAISAGLAFLVIYEVFERVLGNYLSIQHLGRILFAWSAAILVCFAILSATTAPGTKGVQFSVAVLTTERSVGIVQCGLLVFLFFFASSLRLSWRDYVFGIALGFAIAAITDLAIVAIRIHGGPPDQGAFILLKPASFDCAVMIWAIYLLQPHRVLQSLQLPDHQLLEWDQAIERLLHR